MTKLHDEARDVYHACETHGEIVDKIERMLILEAQNADLLAALEVALDSMTNQKPLGTREIVLKRIRAAIDSAKG